MPPTPPTQRMGELHEERFTAALGMKKTKASGSRWDEQADGRHGHDEPFAFRADGKSTKGKSITVTLETIGKIRDQAHGERPAIPLAWYGNEALTQVLEDWIAVPLGDFAEMRDAAVAWSLLETGLEGDVTPGQVREVITRIGHMQGLVATVKEELRAAEGALSDASRMLAERDDEIADLKLRLAAHAGSPRVQAAPEAETGVYVPGFIPRLPWFVVSAVRSGSATRFTAVRYGADGHMHPVSVSTVRVERSLGSGNRPRLIVDDIRIPAGDLFTDGLLVARVCADTPSLEVG